MVMILGEVASKTSVNYEQVIRETVKAVGYDSDDKGLDWRTTHVIVAVEDQGTDLASQTVIGAPPAEGSESSVVCGYATDETDELMPLSHSLANKLCQRLDSCRKDGTLAWAHPCGMAQVSVEYSEVQRALVPARIHSVALTVQHSNDVKPEQIQKELMDHVVKPTLPAQYCDDATKYHLDQAKQPLSGSGHVGMTGRRIASDTYGGWGHHSSVSLSGKDASKGSRVATYGARWAAVSLVAGKHCKRAAVQLTYACGSAEPVAISVDAYGTSNISNGELVELLKRNFDFKPSSLQRDLDLKSVQFQKLSAYGHMGRIDMELTWEKHKELK